jgi:hypothetical protein
MSSMMNQTPPAKPWVVRTMRRSAASLYHPWAVEVDNHYYLPGAAGFKCFWHVDLTKDARYDLSRAKIIPE